MAAPGRQTAVLLVGFGGPESLAEVPAFVKSVLGRTPPEHVLRNATERYVAIGGRSPLPDTTRLQAHLLGEELRARGLDWHVGVGMLHAPPSVAEAVTEVLADGATDLVALSLAPYRCEVSTDAYEAAVTREAAARLTVHLPADWNLNPDYLGALSERLAEELEQVPEGPAVPVIFSAHSLPMRMIEAGDPYADQLRATATALATGLGLTQWHLAYQSISASADQPWLGPTVEEVIDRLAAEGGGQVLVDPIGFVSDHLETLYDNDVEHRRRAEELGMSFYRAPCLNDHPRFIRALTDIAIATLED